MQKCPKFKRGKWLKCAECPYLSSCVWMHPKMHPPKREEGSEAQELPHAPVQTALKKRSQTFIYTEHYKAIAEQLCMNTSQERELVYYMLNVNLSCGQKGRAKKFQMDDLVRHMCYAILRRDGRSKIKVDSKLMKMVRAKLHRAFPQLWS